MRGQQKVFETAHSLDPVVGFVIAALVAFLGSFIARVMGFFIVFIAPIIGLGITEAIRYAVKKRRSRVLFRVSTAGAIIGSLPLLASIVLVTLSIGSLSLGLLVPLLWQGLYTFLIASTVYYRLSGIQM